MTIAILKRNGIFPIKNPAKQSGGLQISLAVINLIIIFSCTGTLIYQSKTSLDRFLDYETKAILTGMTNIIFSSSGKGPHTNSNILSVKPTGDVSFVAFTVCPSYEDAYNQEKLAFYGTTRDQYRQNFSCCSEF